MHNAECTPLTNSTDFIRIPKKVQQQIDVIKKNNVLTYGDIETYLLPSGISGGIGRRITKIAMDWAISLPT